MTTAAIVNSWQQKNQTVSVTICDGNMSALVFAVGEPYTVRAENFEQLVQQIDNLLNDIVYKDCRCAPLVIK